MVIRDGVEADGPALRAVCARAYTPYISVMGCRPGPMLADYEAHLRSDKVLVVEKDEGGHPVGYAIILHADDGYWLDNIAVDPAAQGEGIGRRLILAVEDWLHARTDRYRLYTNVMMTANIGWYRSLGFRETGRHHVDGFDRVYFEKQLPAGSAGIIQSSKAGLRPCFFVSGPAGPAVVARTMHTCVRWRIADALDPCPD